MISTSHCQRDSWIVALEPAESLRNATRTEPRYSDIRLGHELGDIPRRIQAFWWKSFCLSGRRTLRSSLVASAACGTCSAPPELQCLFIHRSVEQSLQQRLYRDADVDRSVLTVPTSESAFSRVVFIAPVSFSRAIRCEFFEALKKAYASWGQVDPQLAMPSRV